MRSFYANQNTRTPLIAAFIQATAFILLSIILSPIIGLAGIPLSAALTFTIQAVVLLTILNRRFPGLLKLESTGIRAAAAAVGAGLVTAAVLAFLPIPTLLRTLVALLTGGLAALPLIWQEVRLLLNL